MLPPFAVRGLLAPRPSAERRTIMLRQVSTDVTPLDALATAALHDGSQHGSSSRTVHGQHFSPRLGQANAFVDPLLADSGDGSERHGPGGADDEDALAFASASKRVRRAKQDWEDFPTGDFDVTFNPPLKSAWKDSWSWRSLKSTKLASGSKIARACQGLLECSKKCGFTERPFVHGNKLEVQKKGSRCQNCSADMVHLPCTAKSSIVKDPDGRIIAFEHQGLHPHPRPSAKRGIGPTATRQPPPWAGVGDVNAPEYKIGEGPSVTEVNGASPRDQADSTDGPRQRSRNSLHPLPPVLALDKATLTKPICIFCSRPWPIAVNSGDVSDERKGKHLLDHHRFDLARLIALDPHLELRFDGT